MFIADILDSEAPVAVCCRPKGFGKSMNLSMLKCYLERPDHRRPDRSPFVGSQIWQAGGGHYRDEYACYPIITLDFSAAAAGRDADAAAAIRSAVANECARLLPLLAAPDLSRREVRLIERAARGVASDKEIDAALGVLIKLLQAAFDEQVVLLIDDYDAVCPKRLDAKDDGSVDSLESLSRMLFDTIADAGDSLRLTCLMGERPGHAEFALSQRGVSYRSATALSSWCDRWFGFSDDEVQVLLDCIGRNGCLDDAREWLEGYLFGGFYCSSPERVVDYAQRDCVAPVRADLYGYADLVGINMEGPFISPKKVGAQNPEYVQGADAAMFRRLQKRANGLIKLVDVAPEEPGNLDFIRECHNEVRISIAHTCTDYDTVVKAFEAGATHMTHLYNAMPGITHRAPGPIIAAMEHDAEVELITDNVHIHPAMVRFTFNTFGDDRICLIADSAMSCGLPDGQYSLGGQAITVKGPRATLTEHPDTIAGSNTCLYDCMKRAVLEMNVPLESAVRAASETPAKSIGVDNDYGSLAAGRYGNVILADKELNLKAVIQKGVRIV